MCFCSVVCFADDGGGTPVQDEHPGSDGEEMRSDRHQSEVRLTLQHLRCSFFPLLFVRLIVCPSVAVLVLMYTDVMGYVHVTAGWVKSDFFYLEIEQTKSVLFK